MGDGQEAPLVVAAWTDGSRERLGALLREHGFDACGVADDWPMRCAPCRRARWRLSRLGSSVVSSATASRWWANRICSAERISRPPRQRKRADQFIAEATDIAEGDLVVHQDHGIGRYDGL